jgi:hypothetical protein
MIKVHKLTVEGEAAFAQWLLSPEGKIPPNKLLDDPTMTELFGDYEVDSGKKFSSRLEFGKYLNERLAGANFNELMSPSSDSLWAWLAILYFDQLTEKGIRRSEHYVVTRKGSAGSLAYRNAARTSFELVHIHGEYAEICLKGAMHTFGDMTEQLASRQAIAHNKGFFQTAYEMYTHKGTLRRGASSKPKKPKERKPGDRTGLGGVRRLALALQRLDLTYDTDDMRAAEMKLVLPKEFKKWLAPQDSQ